MKHRAIKDLSQLNLRSFRSAISEGLCLVKENATEIVRCAVALAHEGKFRGYNILQTIAAEEAAKYLILIDAVRCPFSDSAMKSRQLMKFNEHLAKGIYAKACSWRPDKFGSLRQYVERELRAYYLDGPEGVDWIFRNQILAEREELSYVDYVEMDGMHQWLTPQRRSFMDDLMKPNREPSVVKMMRAAHMSKVFEIEALQIVADSWSNTSFDDNTHYPELRSINMDCWRKVWELTQPSELTQEQASLLVNEFPFPMCAIDMKLVPTKRSELEELQRNWLPD